MKRIVVVGFGFMGITHTINILNNKNLELLAIVDKNTGFIEKALINKTGNISTGNLESESLRNIKKYSDLDSCLKKEKPDALIICVPTSSHYEITRQALLNNVHVFLEKPICQDISQAEELIGLAQQKDRVFMIGHVVRFMPPYQQLKEWVDTREFGDLIFLSLHRFSGKPAWGQWIDKSVADTSGGALFDLLIHDIDFANYISGVPDSIECSYLPGSLSKHDYINSFWTYRRRNLNISIEGGNRFHINLPFHTGYLAQFEKASVMFSSLRENVICIADDKNMEELITDSLSAGYNNELEYFINCLEMDRQPDICLPESSLEAIKLCYKHIEK